MISGYFNGAGGKVVDDDGWFRTGDVANMDANGFLSITDRAKDVIKSGGEWISSIEIENLTVSHPAVQEAAVIATRIRAGRSDRCCWCIASTARP